MTEEHYLTHFLSKDYSLHFKDLKGKEFLADASKGDNTCKYEIMLLIA